MATAHVFIAASLDGFIARSDGSIDWLEHVHRPGEDYDYQSFLQTVDGLIMGRGTYEVAANFAEWPYPKPALVLSHTLGDGDIPPRLQGKVRIVDDTPQQALERVAREGWNRAYVDGGKLIQSFLRAGLVEDLIVSRLPILLGEGIPLFGPIPQEIPLRHVETKAYDSGLVQSKYSLRG